MDVLLIFQDSADTSVQRDLTIPIRVLEKKIDNCQ